MSKYVLVIRLYFVMNILLFCGMKMTMPQKTRTDATFNDYKSPNLQKIGNYCHIRIIPKNIRHF